jgi:hypothetical protein
MVELPADPLKLSADGELGAVEIDVRPTESENFATAQAEHEDQDLGRAERIVVITRRFQEAPRFLARPRLSSTLRIGGNLTKLATFRVRSSSLIAWDKAERSVLRMSLTIRGDGRS